MTSTSRNDKAHKSSARPARIPMSAGNKLHVPDEFKKEGYQQYWQVDRPGVIEQMERAWWEKVTDDKGQPITVPSGETTLYLMHIEDKYYQEDMERQQKQNIETTAKQAQSLGEEEYIPKGHSKVAEREII